MSFEKAAGERDAKRQFAVPRQTGKDHPQAFLFLG